MSTYKTFSEVCHELDEKEFEEFFFGWVLTTDEERRQHPKNKRFIQYNRDIFFSHQAKQQTENTLNQLVKKSEEDSRRVKITMSYIHKVLYSASKK